MIVVLRRIGAAKTADALAQLVPLLEASGPQGPTWNDFLERRGIVLDAHETNLESYEELWGYLDRFVSEYSPSPTANQ